MSRGCDVPIENNKKVAIEFINKKCIDSGLSDIMIDKIISFYKIVGNEKIFGRKDIAENFKFSYSNAGKVIVAMKKADLIIEVVGKGKGKYRFI